jgi:hypothetical protein
MRFSTVDLSEDLLHHFSALMPSFPAFVIKNKTSANLTYFVWVKRHFSINFNIIFGKLGIKF